MVDHSFPGWEEGIQPLDSLGLFCVLFTLFWNLFIGGGIIWILAMRHIPSLKMRNIPLTLCALCMLHMYWIVYMLNYPLRGTYACTMEYWMMSIVLPFGIALFQANNIQLLHTATLQSRFVESDTDLLPPTVQRKFLWGFSSKLGCFSYSRGTAVAIGAGMVFQFFIAAALFLGSRKFHDGFGLWSEYANEMQCRQGPEWIPAIMWQVFWAWIYAPLVLYKIRNIRDVHYWRLQTSLCVVAGLFGFPMWAATVYSPWKELRQINSFFAPPMWFLPGIMMMEFVTIFFPLFESIRSRRHQTQITEQENRRPHQHIMDSPSQGGGRYSLASLEETLANNPSSLLQFAASKDFSGENITFLNHIRDWKAAWVEDSNPEDFPRGYELYCHLFNVGVEIYATFVNISTSQYPVNIESAVYKGLKDIFEQAAKLINIPETANIVTPFDQASAPRSSGSVDISLQSVSRPSTAGFSEASTIPNSASRTSSRASHEDVLIRGLGNVVRIKPRLPAGLTIPPDFSPSVFNEAERSVKLLVLRDTWPKYVDSMEEAASHATEAGEKKKKKFWPFKSKK